VAISQDRIAFDRIALDSIAVETRGELERAVDASSPTIPPHEVTKRGERAKRRSMIRYRRNIDHSKAANDGYPDNHMEA
jgi:hypothetical protein